MSSFDRLIATDMSANIVTEFLDRGWTVSRIARAIGASMTFVQGVQAKRHVLTTADVEVLAKRSRQSAPLMLLNALEACGVKPEYKPLFDSTRAVLETSAGLRPARQKTRKRAARRRAA
jgi:hypothetical protein